MLHMQLNLTNGALMGSKGNKNQRNIKVKGDNTEVKGCLPWLILEDWDPFAYSNFEEGRRSFLLIGEEGRLL
jgi:hypothetical protein